MGHNKDRVYFGEVYCGEARVTTVHFRCPQVFGDKEFHVDHGRGETLTRVINSTPPPLS